MPQNQAFRASKGASGFSRPRIPGRKGVNGFSPAKRCTEEASSAIPLRNAITEVRPRPIIPHAIPTQPNPVSTQNPQNSNDQTSDHETRPRELHAKLLGRRGLAGLRDNAPSEARGADGSRAGRHPPAHTATRHHWCGGRRRDRRARAGFEIDHSEPSGSRVAISRAAGPDGARNTCGTTSNKNPGTSLGSGVSGGGWGIRTPEGLHPTRFPSVRHRPLGESSVHIVPDNHKQ